MMDQSVPYTHRAFFGHENSREIIAFNRLKKTVFTEEQQWPLQVDDQLEVVVMDDFDLESHFFLIYERHNVIAGIRATRWLNGAMPHADLFARHLSATPLSVDLDRVYTINALAIAQNYRSIICEIVDGEKSVKVKLAPYLLAKVEDRLRQNEGSLVLGTASNPSAMSLMMKAGYRVIDPPYRLGSGHMAVNACLVLNDQLEGVNDYVSKAERSVLGEMRGNAALDSVVQQAWPSNRTDGA